MNELRIGEVLLEQGVLTRPQLDVALEEQKRSHRPFGLICEQRFGIDPCDVERAWSTQYARLTRRVQPEQETFDPQVRSLVTRRQAWQFCVLPIRYDGSELMLATTEHHLLRALRFACNVLETPAYVVIADADVLGRAMAVHYPLPGINEQSLGGMLKSLCDGSRKQKSTLETTNAHCSS